MFFSRQLLRSVVRRPTVSALIVTLCGIGVALSTAVFAVVHNVLLEPLPYREADRLVVPWNVAQSFGIESYPYSWDEYHDYRDGIEAFEGIAATRTVPMTLEGASRPTSVSGTRVTENLFDVLGVEPVIGRVFRPEAGDAPETGSAVISYGLWQRVFGGAPEVLGSSVRLDGEPHTIIGVLPPHHRYPRTDSDVFVPLVIAASPENVRAFHFLRLVARLREGRTLEDAEAEVKGLAARLAEEYPDASGELSGRVVSMKDEIVGTTRRSLEALFTAVQLLFLVAWANVGILLLARGMARRSELELLTALGATRRRLFALLLCEASLLAAVGCILGLAAGYVAVDALKHVDPSLLPRVHEVRFSRSLVVWAFGLGFVGVVVFGSLPAWAATRGGLGSGRTTDRRTSRLNRRLLAAQIALALPLIVASSMELRSVRALARVDTGYRLDQALVAGVSLPANQFGPAEQKAFVDRAVELLAALPGVTSVGATSHLPLSQRNASIVTYRPDQAGQSGLPNAQYRVISPGLLRTLGVGIVSGREFEARDDRESRPIVVIDDRLAKVLFPDRDAVGQKIRLGTIETEWEIMGVARAAQWTSLDGEADYTVYVPILQNLFPGALSTPELVLRADAGAPVETLVARVRETLQSVDPDQAVLEVRPLAHQVDDWLGERRAVTGLLWTIAVAALVLAGAGVYATLSFAVGRRLREMAIRSALGAGRKRLARDVVLDGMRPGLLGIGAGIALGVLVGRALAGTLYGVGSIDVRSLGAASFLMAAVMALACIAPARRALGESPARLLRDDGS